MGVLTGHSASTGDFNWSTSCISVRIWAYFSDDHEWEIMLYFGRGSGAGQNV